MSADDIFADNPLCRLLAIRYPICQAGMYQVAYSSLAAAVSNAGGLGMIGSAYMPPARLREEIRTAAGLPAMSRTAYCRVDRARR
jgi:enoyl-[acyl-carrier protein] reductase II